MLGYRNIFPYASEAQKLYSSKFPSALVLDIKNDYSLSTFRNNTIATVFFESVLGSIARGLSTDRVCEVGTMSEANITSTDIIEFRNSFNL